ncbi:MAG: hypothetical protein WBO36_10555, partial [Saprospiraceae bacterium]
MFEYFKYFGVSNFVALIPTKIEQTTETLFDGLSKSLKPHYSLLPTCLYPDDAAYGSNKLLSGYKLSVK